MVAFPGKSFRNSAISAKVRQMAQWLIIVSWVAVILGLLTALAIAFDVTASPQHMKIMNVVWPITGLYQPVIGWLLYTNMARRTPMACPWTCALQAAGVRFGKAHLSRQHTAPRVALLAISSAPRSCFGPDGRFSASGS